MAAFTICSDFGAPKNKVWHCFHCFPSISMYSIISIYFMSFSSLIAIARNSRTMLNNSNERGHPCLVPDLRRNAFSFFTIENNVCCGYVIYGLYYVEIGSFNAQFRTVFFFFYHEWVLNIVESFFCVYWDDLMIFITIFESPLDSEELKSVSPKGNQS